MCEPPVEDCDPAPGGAAAPTCIPGTDDMGETQFCALACAPGECPTGMICATQIAFGDYPPVDICT